MVSSNSTSFEKEPTPELETQCNEIIRQWQAGELPFRDAAIAMNILREEAIVKNHFANEGRVEYLLGYMQGYRSNLNISIKHFERARMLFSRVENEARVMRCDLNLGESYRQKGDFTKARRLFRSAYEKSILLGEIGTQTIARSNEGLMLLSMGQIESARAALNEALGLSKQWDDRNRTSLAGLLCEMHHGLAVISLNDNDLHKAWFQANRALEIAQEIEQPLNVGFASRTMGEVLTALEASPDEISVDEATRPDDYFRASIDAFRSLDAEGEMARTMHIYARCLVKQGRRVPAARTLQQATIIFAKLGMVDDAAKAAESQAEIF
jgi:tetratricopeptide (TPR) repeat protein